jgi:beta-glucanase (GH16 family)
VSGIQSGNRSGPVGSTDGQQRFRDGLTVRQAQPRFDGWLATSGRVEIRLRMDLSERSMAAMWLAGFEERPREAGEICVVEVFGRSVDPGRSAEIGMGVKAVNDPRLVDDFAAPRLDLDVSEYHTYAVEWDGSAARFEVDGEMVRECLAPPTYRMQIMIALFDFPSWGPEHGHWPSLSVDWVRGTPGEPSTTRGGEHIRPSTR